MSGFKEPSLAERQNASIKAKNAALENFRAKAAAPAKKKMANTKGLWQRHCGRPRQGPHSRLRA
jgi:hypothetical protein